MNSLTLKTSIDSKQELEQLSQKSPAKIPTSMSKLLIKLKRGPVGENILFDEMDLEPNMDTTDIPMSPLPFFRC